MPGRNVLIYPEIFRGGNKKIRAFFTGIIPGVDKDAVCRLMGISGRDLIMPVQRHTSRVLVYDGEEADKFLPEPADAVITGLSAVAIGVKTADCVPILLADEKKGAIGAVHAGWRGTAAAILPAAIGKMNEACCCRPEDIRIAIGPSIRGCCYEVGRDVLTQVSEATGGFLKILATNENGILKARLDLAEANRAQALQAGAKAENIWVSDVCTCCNTGRFNSYRRETIAGTGHDGGRQGGFIMRVKA